jgi:short-subunit dehydrogenase
VLPNMLKRQSGHIVLVTSIDGKKGMPRDAPYAAAKFALAGFGEVMRQELFGTGVHVTTVCPGRVDTPMIEALRVPWVSPKIAPEIVARAIVRGIRHRRAEIVVPSVYTPLLAMNVLLPRFVDWFVRVFHIEGWKVET